MSKFQAHPWHGVHIGEDAPEVVMAYIEMVPSDTFKYEIDKESGLIVIDRPQKFSNHIPAPYGFVTQTYCAEEVAEYCCEKTGRTGIDGDGDALDICVLTNREVPRGNLLMPAIPIGGFRMIDGGEADDKIIAVLKGDVFYEQWKDLADCPESIVERLRHYFLTYKGLQGPKNQVEITHTYDKAEAIEVIKRSQNDYKKHYGDI